MTQCDRIMRHLREVGPITGAEAMREYGIQRLASRISDLRHDGVEIHSKMKSGRNRYGEPTSYKEYFLEEEKDA